MTIPYVSQFWMEVGAWAQAASMPTGVLGPAAAAGELDALDADLVAGCPDELRALLGVHDGAGAEWFCFSGGAFLSAREIRALCVQRSRDAATWFDPAAGSPECQGAVRPLWWSELWVPFLMRNKEPVCIDLGPAHGGVRGQIIEIDWEGRCNRVVADGMEPFLRDVLRDLP